MQALRDGNAAWASAPAVGQLFADDAVLVAVDRSTHHGKPAVLKRLNAGMEQLLTMAGAASEAQLPAFELQGPSPGPEGAMVVTLKLRRGLQRLSFVMTFRLVEGRIVHLQNARS